MNCCIWSKYIVNHIPTLQFTIFDIWVLYGCLDHKATNKTSMIKDSKGQANFCLQVEIAMKQWHYSKFAKNILLKAVFLLSHNVRMHCSALGHILYWTKTAKNFIGNDKSEVKIIPNLKFTTSKNFLKFKINSFL